MILNYITLFSVGKDSEALIIDLFERTEELIVWDSREQYFEARQREPEVIDGGVYSYWMVAATSAAPDDLISNRIVSFLAPPHVYSLLDILHSVVRAMRSAEWPEWPDSG